MREDMFKVIVERPRLIRSNGYDRDGRKFRNREEAPMRMGMRDGYAYRKHFNENLAPLRRYLARQVDRPWDRVYSEIRSHIDARSTVKRHILEHLSNFVETDLYWDDSAQCLMLRRKAWTTGTYALEGSRIELYVDPRTGILCRNVGRLNLVRRERERRKAANEAERQSRIILSELRQLHHVDGIWFEITLAKCPPPVIRRVNVEGQWRNVTERAYCYCVLRKVVVSTANGFQVAARGGKSNMDLFGHADVYAVSKRQLGHRELVRHGLRI